MLITHLALVSLTEATRISASALSRVAAALQKQATRDFNPMWQVTATVDAFDRLEDVPVGYWPLIVVDDVPDAAGFHLDENGQPFSLIEFSDSWSLTASHEMLEMLADPLGDRLIAGTSPHPDQGVVEFLVEVADPSEAAEFGYTVNGMLVSDFFTPRFYDPVAADGVRYSFGGHIKQPRQILRGGYITWRDPVTGEWWQQTWFSGDRPKFRKLGRLTGRSIRAAVDAATKTVSRIARDTPDTERFTAARELTAQAKESTRARAEAWRRQIDRLRSADPLAGAWEGGREDNA
ncbi:hypothetical protein JK361_24995 [Streptomyces sp. 5-8]|uniref:Uncharacterized protein n=1 Tax=Streptomyces musisoli TaxID=2802280 RepID=A0ABS1P612_9ACTN|nr:MULTISPECIES: hypothetical protein [Streptomyces]MBL1107810.1 hypothetical protein [Streptomyces musisoli]MBY8843070.1 hypothetical protein [Streptomyces sp. SP2-10]